MPQRVAARRLTYLCKLSADVRRRTSASHSSFSARNAGALVAGRTPCPAFFPQRPMREVAAYCRDAQHPVGRAVAGDPGQHYVLGHFTSIRAVATPTDSSSHVRAPSPPTRNAASSAHGTEACNRPYSRPWVREECTGDHRLPCRAPGGATWTGGRALLAGPGAAGRYARPGPSAKPKD